jgi:hypothetical protein
MEVDLISTGVHQQSPHRKDEPSPQSNPFDGAALPSASAQQVLVDDPTSVATGAAPLEARNSTETSWVVPAVRVFPPLEVSAGAAFVKIRSSNRRSVEYSAEGTVLPKSGSAHRVGIAAVGGTGLPGTTVARIRTASVCGYGILSQDLLPDRVEMDVPVTRASPFSNRTTWGTVGLPVTSAPLY